ncbi:MAG: hypothetical protein NTV94_02495, partial [Planctomycetota bacterium]|nr:hypothetical protein [Planctomycetota bacterium]
RGQNVRLAARLTGWDVDILTPDEFRKGLEIMYATVQSVEGINEQMADKLAALGMVSVFDIEEVGGEVLMTALEVGPEIAATIVETCSVKAKEVAEQQQRDKEEKDRKAREEASMAQTLLGELTALGEGEAPGALPSTEAATEATTQADAAARAADILGNG